MRRLPCSCWTWALSAPSPGRRRAAYTIKNSRARWDGAAGWVGDLYLCLCLRETAGSLYHQGGSRQVRYNTLGRTVNSGCAGERVSAGCAAPAATAARPSLLSGWPAAHNHAARSQPPALDSWPTSWRLPWRGRGA